ncbi:hypothetical protein M071_4512, partial [Bacteroides fragilis str. Ds-233]
ILKSMIFISILINYSKDMFFPLKKENNSADRLPVLMKIPNIASSKRL